MKLGVSRRHLLRSALASGGALAFLAYLERFAYASSNTETPQRFVGVYMPHGVARELFRPRAGFDLSFPDSSLAPFDDPASYGQSFKSQLLVIEGLDLSAGMETGTTGHDASRVILTGSGASGRNASLDQFLAIEAGLGLSTPLSSVVLGVGTREVSLGSSLSYAKGGAPLAKTIDPTLTFEQLFAQYLIGNDPQRLKQAALERQRGQSVLDAVRSDLKRLETRLAGREREKISAYAQGLRELEQRVAGVTRACSIPAAPERSRLPKIVAHQGGEPQFDLVTDLQVDLLAHALACDLTRFATLFLADLSRTHYDAVLPEDIHAGVAHVYSAGNWQHETQSFQGGEPATWLALGRQNRYCYAKLARLLQRLNEHQIANRTLVYATSDMGNPARHSSRAVPTVLLGAAPGLRMGRYLDVSVKGQNQAHNKLLVALARAFGVQCEAFGDTRDPALARGVLAGLT